MKKQEQKIVATPEKANDGNDQEFINPPGKRNFLRGAWIVTLAGTVAMWITLAVVSERTTRIDSDGVMHEPLFELVPVSFFLLLASIVLAAIDMVRNFKKPRKLH